MANLGGNGPTAIIMPSSERFNRNRTLARRASKLLIAIALAIGLLSTRVAWAGQIIHIVQPGENLFRIGLRYGVGWQSLMAANGLVSSNIYVGQALVIPGAGGDIVAAPAPSPAPRRPPRPRAPMSFSAVIRSG